MQGPSCTGAVSGSVREMNRINVVQERITIMRKTDIQFPSRGLACRGWFYSAGNDKKRPCIVMAHGFGGVKEMRLDAYAERFSAAGYHVLVFDYRHFGASDGSRGRSSASGGSTRTGGRPWRTPAPCQESTRPASSSGGPPSAGDTWRRCCARRKSGGRNFPGAASQRSRHGPGGGNEAEPPPGLRGLP